MDIGLIGSEPPNYHLNFTLFRYLISKLSLILLNQPWRHRGYKMFPFSVLHKIVETKLLIIIKFKRGRIGQFLIYFTIRAFNETYRKLIIGPKRTAFGIQILMNNHFNRLSLRSKFAFSKKSCRPVSCVVSTFWKKSTWSDSVKFVTCCGSTSNVFVITFQCSSIIKTMNC